MPSSIRKALDELPITLDDTYTRALECIPQEKWRHAHRLFQCLVAAIRPLRVEELGEILAIEFDSKAGQKLVEDWRPLEAEDAVLSVCSSLISVVDVEDSKIVQFSHFSVKEFLTSGRLASSNVRTISQFYAPLESAHRVIAWACLIVLLQLDEKTDKRRLGEFPLAFYSAEHWVAHAKFGEVTPEIQDVIVDLFDPRKSHLDAWAWIHDIEDGNRKFRDGLEDTPPRLCATSLHFAAFCGFGWLARHLIIMHAEDVNAMSRPRPRSSPDKSHMTPLHSAYRGYRAARKMYDEGSGMESKTEGESGRANHLGHLEVMRVLLENRAQVDDRDVDNEAVSHLAAHDGEVEFLQLLLQYRADINARGLWDMRPLHNASSRGHIKAMQFLLEHRADVNVRDCDDVTPLILASVDGSVDAVRLLLGHGADMDIRGLGGQTAFQRATLLGHHEVAQLLLEHGAEDRSE
jgi:Ankyrin repeats (3 copies)